MTTKTLTPNEIPGTGINACQLKHTLYCLVQRAMFAINDRIDNFQASEKATDHKEIDYVTDADLTAQRILVDGLRESFPEAGIVAEEPGMNRDSQNGVTFVIDPLDGTKKFVRQESGGVSVMVAVVFDDEIVSVFIGNAWTNELYYYRACSENTHRLINFRRSIKLQPFNANRGMERFHLLLRDDPYQFHKFTHKTATFDFARIQRVIKSFSITSGSIGLMFARLWSQSVPAIMLRETTYTPWDNLPIRGITERLGYRFYIFEGGRFVPYYHPEALFIVQPVNELMLVCHPSVCALLNS